MRTPAAMQLSVQAVPMLWLGTLITVHVTLLFATMTSAALARELLRLGRPLP